MLRRLNRKTAAAVSSTASSRSLQQHKLGHQVRHFGSPGDLILNLAWTLACGCSGAAGANMWLQYRKYGIFRVKEMHISYLPEPGFHVNKFSKIIGFILGVSWYYFVAMPYYRDQTDDIMWHPYRLGNY